MAMFAGVNRRLISRMRLSSTSACWKLARCEKGLGQREAHGDVLRIAFEGAL